MSQDPLSGLAESLRGSAADLASRLSARAMSSATIAQERAILRMLGVDGLDRAGRPLASSVAEGYCGTDHDRLASGVLLPFAVALLEYDLPPRELALEVAAGVVDLGLEAEMLTRPERLASARGQALRLLAGALARVDANKTAARDLRDVLGMPPEPWFGRAVQSPGAEPAADEVRALIRDGADVVQIEVPASWEFAQARRQAGFEGDQLAEPGPAVSQGGRTGAATETRRRRPGRGRAALSQRMDRDVIPAGSQRGLAALRIAADEAAAERGCYAGLMTVTSAFAAPEQAAVAAFERIDLVEVDPIREIVEHNVDPERALADQAFAHRLHTRAGSLVVTGAGPLAIGPDIAGGVPAEATTSMGRALALEALGVEIALADGLPAGSLMVGAVPAWVAQEGDSRSMLVQVRLRRLLFPELRLVIHGLASDGPAGNWAAPLVAALTGAPASLVLWDRTGDNASEAAAIHHAAAGAGAALRSGLGNGALHGDAAEQAKRTLEAAVVALERLAAEGWDSVLGPSGGGREPARFGGAAVVERALGPASAAGLLADLF